MKLLYFALVRERIGCAEEDIARPAHVGSVAALLRWLASRSDRYAAALDSPERLRVAVNQHYAGLAHPVADDDEIAIFPPVTGG